MAIDFNNTNEVKVDSFSSTLNLTKGQSLNLEKSGEKVEHLLVGLGWDASTTSQTFDLDASVYLLDSNDKLVGNKPIVYFNSLTANGVKHHGDNLTGDSDGDDEQISIDLTKVDSNVDKIVFFVNIYKAQEKRQTFGLVKNSYISLTNTDNGKKLVRYDLKDDYSLKTGLIVGELIRTTNGWTFHAIGEGIIGNIQTLADKYSK